MYNALALQVCEKRALRQSSAAPAASWAPTTGGTQGGPTPGLLTVTPCRGVPQCKGFGGKVG